MPRSPLLAAVLALTCLGEHAFAGDSSDKSGESARHADCCAAAPCCPDNYCKKPIPCVPCPQWCGTPAEYCKKPMPCVPCPNGCGCPDGYCKKPLPNLCLARNWQFYRCPPCACESPVDAKQPTVSQPAPSQPNPLPQAK